MLFLLGWNDGVLKRLCQAELNDSLGWNLDGCTSLRVTTRAFLAVGLNGLAYARNNELPATLALLSGQSHKVFEHAGRGLFLQPDLIGQVRHHLGLGHHFCHLLLLS